MGNRRRPAARAPLLLACVFLSASHAAMAGAPSKLDCVRANEEAQELRRAGGLVEARDRLRTCAVDACPGPVREDCAERLEDVERSLPTVLVDLVDARGARVPKATGYVDGRPLRSDVGGSTFAVDPGEHLFRFEAEGYVPIERRLIVREKEREQRERFVFVDAAPVAQPSAAPSITFPSDGSTQRSVGVVIAGGGIVAIAVGSVFGLRARSTYKDALPHCASGPQSCDSSGVHDGETAHSEARISTVSFATGAVLLAGAIIVYLTAPERRGPRVEPFVASSAGGLRLSGSW